MVMVLAKLSGEFILRIPSGHIFKFNKSLSRSFSLLNLLTRGDSTMRVFVSLSLTLSLFVPGALAQETPAQAVLRALAAHGTRWTSGQIADWVSEGKLTYFTIDGPQANFNVTLVRKGKSRVQRVIKQTSAELRQGSDGTTSWDSLGGQFASLAQGNTQFCI